VPLQISHEHIGTMIIALRMAFQPPGGTGYRGKVCFVGDGEQHVHVFGLWLRGG
jgi:hypothetical protein